MCLYYFCYFSSDQIIRNKSVNKENDDEQILQPDEGVKWRVLCSVVCVKTLAIDSKQTAAHRGHQPQLPKTTDKTYDAQKCSISAPRI